MTSKKRFLYATIFWLIVLLIISYLLTDSVNPFKVFSSDVKILAKILVGFIMVLCFYLFIVFLIAKTPIGDNICPICQKNILDYAPVYGKPINCWTCFREGRKTQFHSKCFKSVGNKCPICESNENIFTDETQYKF